MNKFLPLFLLFFSISMSFAQDKPQEALQYFAENFPQEKIHVRLNKKSFVAGENIYFKSYIFEGFKPSTISTTLFVEILDKDKKVVEKKMLPIFQGEASGNIKLGENLKEEVYFFRAYTTWMSNFNEKFQWLKPFAVYNPKSSEKIIENPNPDWNITLHPESGNLINKIPAKVAVRMQSNGKNSKKWKGFIFDEKNPSKRISEFESFDENVAQFSFTPEFGKNYKATIEESGKSKTFDLPVVKNNGISLQIKNNSGEIEFSILSNLEENSSKNFKIYGQINNRLVYFAKIYDPKPEKIYKIPTEKLVNGILQFTILDDKDQLVAERLCFVDSKNLKYENPTLQNANLDSGARKLNSFSLPSKSVYTNYAVQVYDDSFDSTEDEYSLPSSLWLTGDLTSEISNPAQYFSAESNADALDALLISEKWQRCDWESLITRNFPKIIYKPVSYIAYKGEATLNDVPASNKTLDMTFSNSNKNLQIFQVKTDDRGYFTMENMFFDEPLDIFYQLNDKKEAGKKNLKVFFKPLLNFVSYKNSLPNTKYILSSEKISKNDNDEANRLLDERTFNNVYNEKVVEIKEVKITVAKEVKTQKLNDELSSSNFKGINETVFDFVNDDNQLVGNVLDWLQGRIPGLQINRDGLELTPKLHGKEMELYVDEFLVPAQSLSSISSSDVAMIKVIRPPFFGASGNGAIAIYLNNGKTGNKSNAGTNQLSSLKSKNLMGFDKVEPFSATDYATIRPEEISNDKRITLFWNPDFISKKNESNVVKFYNNDSAKDLKVTISGYDEENKQYVYYHGLLKDLK